MMQAEVAVTLDPGLRNAGDRALPLDDDAQPVGQHLRAARLVDKVDGAAIQRLQLALGRGVSGQEDDRQFDPLLAQGSQQLETRHLRQDPVEQRNACLDALAHGLEEGRPIGKARDRKTPIGKVR